MRTLLFPLAVLLMPSAAQTQGLSFAPALTYPSGGSSTLSVAVADVNGDGKPDVVVANNEGTVGVLLGTGDGTLQTAVLYDVGGPVVAIAVADVNRDRKPDVIVTFTCLFNTSSGNSCVGVLLGKGDGTFLKVTAYSAVGSGAARGLAIADVNGDGKPDVVVGTSGAVGVLLGNGDGTFGPAAPYSSVGNDIRSVAIGDVNRDGKPDIVVANFNVNTVGVLLGNGDGTFQASAAYGSGGMNPASVAIADVNGDGMPDIVVANDLSGMGVLLGNGDGSFQKAVAYDSGGSRAQSVAVADVNQDGKPDVVVANLDAGTVGVLLGNGDGSFERAVTYSAGGSFTNSLAIGDLNGDGKPDIVVANVYQYGVAGPSDIGVLINTSSSTVMATASSVNPPAGSGTSATFAFSFADTSGWQHLSVVNVLVNSFLDGRNACYLAYAVPSSTLALVDDAGDAGGPFAGSVTPGNPGVVIQNGQCAVSLVSAAGSGSTLTLTLTITFKPGFSGNRIQYLAAREPLSNSGWQALGVWRATSTSPPPPMVVGTMTNARIVAPAGTAQNLTFTLSDIKGTADIGILNVLINDSLDGRHACYLAYVSPTNTLLLVDDAGDAGGPFAGSLVLNGSAGTIQNTQCSISATGSSAVSSGNTLTLTLNITFQVPFRGNRVAWAAGRDGAGGNNTDWQAVATATVQ